MVVLEVVVVMVVVVAVVWVCMNIVDHSCSFLSVEIGKKSNFGESKECVTDGRTDQRMDGPTNGWMDRRMGGPTDGRTDPLIEMRGCI